MLYNATATRARWSGITRNSSGEVVPGAETTSAAFACAIQPVTDSEQLEDARIRNVTFRTLFWADSAVSIRADDRVTVTAPTSQDSTTYRVVGSVRDEGGRGRVFSCTLEVQN